VCSSLLPCASSWPRCSPCGGGCTGLFPSGLRIRSGGRRHGHFWLLLLLLHLLLLLLLHLLLRRLPKHRGRLLRRNAPEIRRRSIACPRSYRWRRNSCWCLRLLVRGSVGSLWRECKTTARIS
jgi:hypothetical protein